MTNKKILTNLRLLIIFFLLFIICGCANEIISCKITLMVDDEEYDVIECNKNDEVSLPTLTLEGYIFEGWKYDNTLITESFKCEKDMTVYSSFILAPIFDVYISDMTLIINQEVQINFTNKSIESGIETNLALYNLTSSNDEIAKVSSSGMIKALSKGTATITIQKDDYKEEFDIEVIIDELDVINNNLSLRTNVTREMTNVYFWLNKIDNNDKILMTQEKISEYNDNLLKNSNPYNDKGTGFVKLDEVNETVSKEEITAFINSSASAAPSTTYNSNCNISNIEDTKVLYGLTIATTSVKNVPTSASSGTNNKYQETAFETGEGVIIYHTSSDNKYYYVQGFNYRGWVLKDFIALCSKEEMLAYTNPSKFVVVTAERIECGVDVRMGTVLPLTKQENGKVWVNIPKKDSDENLVLQEYELELNNEKVNVGYLDYSIKNVLRQMFKMLAYPYDWGDEHGGRDCSSTVDACYKCFGFIMPRNTSSLYNLTGVRYDVSTYTNTSKEACLKELKPGTIILKSGHVMLYLGTDNDVCYIIHNISGGVTITTCNQSSYSFNEYKMFIQMYND